VYKKTKNQIIYLLETALVMAVGLFLLKYIPMKFLGNDIVFDASAHITIAIFILYGIWFFIDQNKKWHIPFFLFSILILTIISFQRIHINAHNDLGLLLGLALSLFAIAFSQNRKLKSKIRF
jgi:heme O synthase-like polyprenyltransferase